MKALFFGTSAFAVPSLRVMAQCTDLFGVVTQPDRPAGRGHKLVPTPVKQAALELGLRVFEPLKLRPFADEIAGEAFDVFGLASYGKILPQPLLDLPRLGALNVHPSLLPTYRGATPIQSAIANGDQRTGVSIMVMDAGMDTGDLVLQEPVDIAPNETYGELHDRLALFGAQLLERAIALAEHGTLAVHPQQGEASLTRPISKDDLLIDWSWSPEKIVRHVRAYAPQPAARALMNGEIVKLLSAHVEQGRVVVDELIAPNRGRMSGETYERSRR